MLPPGLPSTPHETDDGAVEMIELRIKVPPAFDGWRLDHYLKHRIGRLSRTRIQWIIDDQITFADGRRVRASSRVRAGEVIHLDRPAPKEPDVPRHFSVLAEDDDFIVIDKPAGLPIHTTARYWRNTLTAVLRERYPGQRMQVCHRLDRETSGVLLVARGELAASRLNVAFARRRVAKTYLALVHGVPDPRDGVVDLPLALLDSPSHLMMGVTREGRASRTRYSVAQAFARHALVIAEPETGRQHQIRVHMAALGHPIVGDKIYRAGEALFMRFCDEGMTPELLAAFDGLGRQALHAHRLRFPHPRTGAPVEIESPWPAELRDYVQRVVSV
jgi:23S rRNA pseudouridine1911/1915/1917 synthase